MKIQVLGVIFCILIFSGLFPLILPIHMDCCVDEGEVTEAMVSTIGEALALFREDVGRYPENEEGLIALWEQPKNAENWKGPYLKKKGILNDPWRREFRYQKIGQGYRLYSLGKDGKANGMGEDRDIETRIQPK
ncbi:MAG: type II secretion system protein GspG [Gammaproteobacteria bacterium]